MQKNTRLRFLYLPLFLTGLYLSGINISASPYEGVADYIAKKAKTSGKMTIAVLNFDIPKDTDPNLSSLISEELIVELVNNSSVNIVDRSNVEKILKELAFNQTGVIDAQTVKKIGNGLGADALVLGKLTPVGNGKYKLFTRLVDTETFRVLGANEQMVTLEELMSHEESKAGKSEKKDTSQEKAVEDELAAVSIIPFEDRTNSVNFKYLSESLADAINTSMLKDFSYNRVSTRELKRAIYEMEQEELKKNVKKGNKSQKVVKKVKKENENENENLTPEEIEARKEKEKEEEDQKMDEAQLDFVKKLAKKMNTDIIIFGSYNYDEKTNELVFTASIYLGLSKSVRDLDETRNPVDNTLFRATREVSKNLVSEIHQMIEESQKKKEEEVEVAQKTEKKPEKVALTKKVAMISNAQWDNKKMSITINPMLVLGGDMSNGCGICSLQLDIKGRYWIFKNIYAGVALKAGVLEGGQFPFANVPPSFWGFDLTALGGYSIPLGRWLFSAEAGVGYYLITDGFTGKAFYNPEFQAGIGAEVLLSELISVGVWLKGDLYYDQPQVIFLYGGELSVGFAF